GRNCPKGSPAVYCKVAPCDENQCPRYPGARCVNDYCGGCNARYYVNKIEVTKFCPSSPPKCPDGNPPVQCFVAPCTNKTCPAYPEAKCVEDYCGGCNFFFVYNNTNVTSQCAGDLCPAGVKTFNCFVAPCDVSTCPRYPNARCVDDYCGGCNARYFVNDTEVTRFCPSSPEVCPDGNRPVACFQQPCNATRCQAFPNATCVDDYCEGCNARFFISKTEVTQQCCDTPPVNQCPPKDLVNCFVDPCDPRFTSCNNVPTAACSSDYCGGCKARWFLPDCSEATETCNNSIAQKT
ncbi:unnamed protein product, partial [Candidula unifasciata]